MRGALVEERIPNPGNAKSALEFEILNGQANSDFEIDNSRLSDFHEYSSRYPDSGYKLLAANVFSYSLESILPRMLTDENYKEQAIEVVEISIATLGKTLSNDNIYREHKTDNVHQLIQKAYQINSGRYGEIAEDAQPDILTSLEKIWSQYKLMFEQDKNLEKAQMLSYLYLWEMLLRQTPDA